MAKKRRDSDRDPSSKKRVLKAGGAVLAVGAGMALLSRTGQLSKLNDVMPVLRDTTRKFNKELLGKQKRTAMDYYNAYNKSIGPKGQIVKKAIKERRDAVKDGSKILGYNPSTAKMTNVLGRRKHIKQMSNSENLRYVEQLRLTEIQKGIKEGLKKTEKGEDTLFRQRYGDEAIDQIVKETIPKWKEITDKDGKVSTEFLRRTKEMYGISDDDMTKMVESVVQATKAGLEENKMPKLRKESLKLSKKVEEIALEDLKKNTRKNQLINKIGKKLGIKDLDDIVFGSHQATVGEVLQEESLKKLGLSEQDFEEVIKNRLKIKGREKEHLINTLKEELDFLKLYIEIVGIRFGDAIRFHWNIDESLYDCNIIKMCLQPIVENAIKYNKDNGIVPKTIIKDIAKMLVDLKLDIDSVCAGLIYPFVLRNSELLNGFSEFSSIVKMSANI